MRASPVQVGFATTAGDETSSDEAEDAAEGVDGGEEQGTALVTAEARESIKSTAAATSAINPPAINPEVKTLTAVRLPSPDAAIIHSERDWRDFYDRLCFASTKLGRINSKVAIPDAVFLEKTWRGTGPSLVWYSQQNTERGKGVYKVLRAQTHAHGILAQLERHMSLLLGEVADGTPRHACVATYTDRQEVLTFAQVSAILFELKNIGIHEGNERHSPEQQQLRERGGLLHDQGTTVYGRPPHFPFCFSFIAPPDVDGIRYISSSVANEREGLLLGAVALTSRQNDYFQRRGMARRPPEWRREGNDTKHAAVGVDSEKAIQRTIAVGMRQLCRSLVLQRRGIDLTKDLRPENNFDSDIDTLAQTQRHARLVTAATDVRGVVLEFTFSTDRRLWFSGIVSITKMRKKTHNALPQTFSNKGGAIHSAKAVKQPVIRENAAAVIFDESLDNNSDNNIRLPIRPSTSRPASATSTPRSSSSVFDPHTGKPVTTSKRIGGGHAYAKTSSSETIYTPVVGAGRALSASASVTRRRQGRKAGTSSSAGARSVLLAYGARHCPPPALVAMGHRIDTLMGQLSGEIQNGKKLEEEVEHRDHTIAIMGDHTAQLRHRISSLEQELATTRQDFAVREADLLRDLHQVRTSLDQTKKEKSGAENTLIALQHKLVVIEASAKDERGSIMQRMVEYDEAGRNAKAEIERLEKGVQERDEEIVKLTEELSKERSACDSLKESLRDIKENIDSMGASHDMAVDDMNEYRNERNALFRKNGDYDSRLKHGRGKPFKLYAWDILATHANPRAELEIVFSVFHHFNVELKQVYVHYASHAAPVFETVRQGTPNQRGFGSSDSTSRIGARSGKGGGTSGRLRLLMTRSDFRAFSRDSGICDPPLFPISFVDLCFNKAILGGTRKGGREVMLEGPDMKARSGIRGSSNRHRMVYNKGGPGKAASCEKVPAGTMTRREFKEALLRLAHARFSHLDNIADKVSLMIEQHILPSCEAALNPLLDDDDSVRLGGEWQRSGYGV